MNLSLLNTIGVAAVVTLLIAFGFWINKEQQRRYQKLAIQEKASYCSNKCLADFNRAYNLRLKCLKNVQFKDTNSCPEVGLKAGIDECFTPCLESR